MSEGQIQKISIFDHLIVHSELYKHSEFIIFFIYHIFFAASFEKQAT